MEGEVEKVTVLLNFELLKQSFQSLLELLIIRMYEEEKVENKLHRIGFGTTWCACGRDVK